MPYPLTGSAQSATGVTVAPMQTAVAIGATRTWGYATFPGYQRAVNILLQGVTAASSGGSSAPPTTGQLWPRGGRTSTG